MNSKIETCKNCHNSFAIEPDDFNFYEKIQVPPPTWCPECRLRRRMAFGNERTFYKRTCRKCGKSTISIYPQNTAFSVYCLNCWRSDAWDGKAYGKNYDFSKPFFEQIRELKRVVPRAALIQQGNMEGSEYTNRASNNKNCYLIFRANYNENCLYSQTINNSRDCVDCSNVQNSELMYTCIDCINCRNTQHSQESKDCNNSYFLYDCRGCTDCFGCVNLRNKQYYIFNQPYSREEYERKIGEFQLGNAQTIGKIEEDFQKLILKFPKRYMMSTQSNNVSGNWLIECKNALNSFGCRKFEDGKYLFYVIEAKDSMDYLYWGRSCETIYETANCGYNSSRIFFSNECWMSCSDLQYCDSSVSCRNCFGCVGLRNDEYCILNKQYSKDEYEELVPQIIEHMSNAPYKDKIGRTYKYGEFFPEDLSPFAYNETGAQEYFPVTKIDAPKKGYVWKDSETRDYEITIKPENLSDTIQGVDNDILNQVVGCLHRGECNEQCTTAFKITPNELQFYRKMNIPPPELCPNCRHIGRHKKRNPPKLQQRKCDCSGKQSSNNDYLNTAQHFHGSGQCPNEFETSYSPKRKEIVYCEQCYNSEVV